MEIFVKQGDIQAETADAIIVNLFEGATGSGGATGVVNKALGGLIGELIAGGDLRGKLGETAVLYPRALLPARRVIVVGLGSPDTFNLEAVREAAGVAIKQARKVGAGSVATIIHGGGIGGLDVGQAAQAVVEGSVPALYKYDAPRSKDTGPENQVKSLTLVEFDEAKIGQIETGAQAGQVIAGAVCLARTMVNTPPNSMTPTHIADISQAVCAENGLSCRVLDEADMRSEGMGLLLAVTQGSVEPAKFIIMEHKPAGASNSGPVVLVGKGVAFDTGGYTLKSQTGMWDMKGDMAGAASVIGAMQGVAQLNLPLHVVGLVPTVENMLSGSSYKIDDVFIAKNGVSVEITSTDAEGRLILADALCYAGTLNPAAVIDVATLTSGKVLSLGNRISALFVNEQGPDLGKAIIAAGKNVGEPAWQLPLDAAYDRQLKSDVADLKNSGGRMASAVTAARFLAHFAGEWPWAHLDIAGGEFYSGKPEDTPRSYLTKGASGTPLRTLVEVLRGWE